MRLSQRLQSDLVLISPPVRGRDELFQLLGNLFRGSGLVASADTVVKGLLEREAVLSTGIGGGVAVPHAQIDGLSQVVLAASVHPLGIDYPSRDDRRVQLVFCLLGGADTASDHLAGLARLARLARREEAVADLVHSSSGEQFLTTLTRLEGE